MAADLVIEARDAAESARHAKRSHAFARAIQDFLAALRKVPDVGPGELARDDLAALRTLGDEVIEEIERRLDSGDEEAQAAQELAAAVYAIRAALEEINHWERHYF